MPGGGNVVSAGKLSRKSSGIRRQAGQRGGRAKSNRSVRPHELARQSAGVESPANSVEGREHPLLRGSHHPRAHLGACSAVPEVCILSHPVVADGQRVGSGGRPASSGRVPILLQLEAAKIK
eukprot:7391941-Prymnesium_polylepis.1